MDRVLYSDRRCAGCGFVHAVKPGLGIDLSGAEEVTETAVEAASLQDTLLNFVPTNVVESMADGSMVPCIVFAIFFGVAMGAYTRQSGNRNMADWVIGLNKVITNIIKTVMYIAPIGIFCLLADVAGSTGFAVIIPMAKFLGVLLIGDVIQFLIYGPITAVLCGVNPFKMPKKFGKMSLIGSHHHIRRDLPSDKNGRRSHQIRRQP